MTVTEISNQDQRVEELPMLLWMWIKKRREAKAKAEAEQQAQQAAAGDTGTPAT